MASKGRIDAYLDCNSPYSFFAFTWLRRNKEALAEHGVVVEFHPVFLGGINVSSGNKPPWTLPAKAAYGKLDGPRAQKYFGTMALNAPSFFPVMTLLPMRAMLYVQRNFPTTQYEAAFLSLWTCYWGEHMDISKSENLIACLERTFTSAEASEIIEKGQSAEFKDMLKEQTAMLVEKGAFGAPWYLVKNAQGKEESFFGSDRFAFMLQYLGVPFQDIEILPVKEVAML